MRCVKRAKILDRGESKITSESWINFLQQSMRIFPSIRENLGDSRKLHLKPVSNRGKKTRRQNNKQSSKGSSLNHLTKMMEQVLSIEKRRTSSKRKAKKNKPTRGGRRIPGDQNAPQSTTLNHGEVNAGSVTAVSVGAQLAPFQIPKGIAKCLTNSIASQSVSARGQTTITVPTASTMLFVVTPSAASDSNASSFAAVVFPNSSSGTGTSTLTSSTVGNSAATCANYFVVTNTPYSTGVLVGGDYKTRLVSAGCRIRNVTENLYRGGVLRYVYSPQSSINPKINVATSTFGSIQTVIDSDQSAVRKHFDAMTQSIDIPMIASDQTWVDSLTYRDVVAFTPSSGVGQFAGVTALASPWDGGQGFRFGGTTSANYVGVAPTLIGYFTNSSSGSQTIDIEMVEHYEYHGTDIVSLHTPGSNHIQSQALVNTLHEHLANQHSSNPHITAGSVLREGLKLSQNKEARKDATLAASIAMCLA